MWSSIEAGRVLNLTPLVLNLTMLFATHKQTHPQTGNCVLCKCKRSENFTHSQSEKSHPFHSLMGENFTLSRVNFSLFLVSDHSNHSFSSDFFYVYWTLNLFTRERVLEWSLSINEWKIHSLKSEMKIPLLLEWNSLFEWNIFHSEKEWTVHSFAYRFQSIMHYTGIDPGNGLWVSS